MLKGIAIRPLKRLDDERGFFTEIMRDDWKDLLGKDCMIQANFAVTYPGIIRAWHRHIRGQVDYFVVIRGCLKICAYEEKTCELSEIVSSGENLQIVRIPGHYWHGYRVLGGENALLIYFTTRLYDFQNPDEERKKWDDPSIRPKAINGRRDDPRVGQSWDWAYPSHR